MKVIVRLAGVYASVCQAASVGPKSVRSGYRQPEIALCCLLLMLATTPLRNVNRCCSGSSVRSGDI